MMTAANISPTHSWALVVLVCVAGLRAELEPSTRELLARIEALETQGAEQRHLIERQEQSLHELRSVIQNQNEKKEQELRIATLETEVEKQKQTIAKLLKFVDESDDTVPDKINGGDVMVAEKEDPKVMDRQRRLVLDNGAVAFLVRMDNVLGNLATNENVRYDTIVTNIGGGYHMNHGLFIAPVSGIYIFSTSVLSHFKPNNRIEVDIEKNGHSLAAAYAVSDSTPDQGSVTVVTQVAVSDEIWVRVRFPTANAVVSGYGFSTFMGCLIMPIEV